MTHYPLPPWKFLCLGMTIFYLIPTRHVKEIVPAPLKISEVVPGFTLGGVYAARYGKKGSPVVSEFGMLPAYVRYGGRKGFFMHHFCADKAHKDHSFRRMMGAGSDPSDFHWSMDDKYVRLEVSECGQPLLNVRMRPIIKDLPFSASFSFLCVKGDSVIQFKNMFASNIGFSATSVDVPKGSPIKGLPLNLKLVSAFWDASNIVMKEPEYLTEGVIETMPRQTAAPLQRR